MSAPRSPTRVAGLGFRTTAPLASLRAVLAEAEAIAGSVSALASTPGKTRAPQLLALAEARALPCHPVCVTGIATPTQSPRLHALHGTGSLAEAAALAAAGPGATLVVNRIISSDGMATCAIAQSKEPSP